MLAATLGVLAVLVSAVGNTHWHISPSLLTYLSGFAVPLAVGVLTKWHVSSGVKAVCNIVLSAIAGALSVAVASNGDIIIGTWVGGIAQTLVVSIASYYGFWKPTGIAQAVRQKTASFGIGGPPPTILPTETLEPEDATVGTVKSAVVKAARAGPVPKGK